MDMLNESFGAHFAENQILLNLMKAQGFKV
jgi:hypothetical protein